MNKRILSLTLALVMILGTFTAVFAEVTTVEQKAAEFLRDNGVLEGDEKGDLLLDKKLERRDAVVLSARLLGEEEKAANTKFDEKTPSWTDVRTDKFYVPFFAWAETTGRFEGKGEGIFEPRAGLTTQEYATVLLRILGHELNGKDAWKTVMALAEKEGLLENVDAKADDILMRGNMAVMTLNALGATVKGTGKTLADELNIKLPVPAKLEVVSVNADNLKEVEVKFNKDVDAKLADAALYSINRSVKIDNARVEGDTVILTVEKTLTNKKEHELTIKGTKDVDGKHKFDVYDNEAPHVVSVSSLGTKAIKVVMSEPVDGVKASDFKLDNKTFFGKVDVNGRDIILTPYGSKLTVGEHELVIGRLKDFAEFRSVETLEVFEVVEDTVAPEVVEVTGTLEKVVVTFSEDVDPDTVNGKTLYWNTKSNSSTAKRIAGNKYEFTFKNALPLYEVTLHIQNVKDYSGNTMKDVEMPFKGELDETRPEVIDVAVKANDDKTVVVRLTKDIFNDDVKAKNFTIKDAKGNVQRVRDVNYAKDSKSTLEVELYRALESGKEYTIKIDSLRDNTRFKNTMIPYDGIINVDKTVGNAEVKSVVGEDRNIFVTFSKEMSLETLVNPENYIITNGKTELILTAVEDVEIEPLENGKVVKITMPKDFKHDSKEYTVTGIRVLSVRDLDNKLITNYNKMWDVKGEALKVKEAKATDKETIVVEFNQEVYSVDERAFTVTGHKLIDAKILSNAKKVELTVDKDTKLPADVKDLKLEATEKSAKDYIETLVNKFEVIDAKIEDGIKPELKTAKLEGTDKIVLTFDEALEQSTDAAMLARYATDIVIENYTTNKDLKAGTDFIVESVKDKTVTVKLLSVKGSEDKKADEKVTLGVKIAKDAKYIADASKAKNAALESEDFIDVKDVPVILEEPAKPEVDADEKAVKDSITKFDTEKPYANKEAVEAVEVEEGVTIDTEVTKEATKEAEGEIKVTLKKGEANESVVVKLAKLDA